MMTVRAASSAMLSVALVPRRAAVVLQKAAHREVVAQEEAHREAAHQEALRQESLAVVAVAPAVMMTITTRLAAAVEAAGDSFYGIRFAKKYAVFKAVKSIKIFIKSIENQKHRF